MILPTQFHKNSPLATTLPSFHAFYPLLILVTLLLGCQSVKPTPTPQHLLSPTPPPTKNDTDNQNVDKEEVARQLAAKKVAKGAAAAAAVTSVDVAVEKAMSDSKGWIPTPEDDVVFGQRDWRSLLKVYDTVRRSAIVAQRKENPYNIQSIGGVIDGVMVGPTTLPLDGANYKVMKVHRTRQTNYGSTTMVNLISRVADAVAAQYPGTVMSVGNMANRYGGDLYWSRSHNTGLDVDLSFYVFSKSTGKQVYLPFFRKYDDEGVCTTDNDLIFDTAKNWALVKALLSDKEATIQRLFISTGLRQLLLDYAKQQHEPEWLLERAEAVLKQPATSPPHNDHLHVRLACPKNDRLFGCLDMGPRYPWADWHDVELRRQGMILASAFQNGEGTVDERVQVLKMLEGIQSPYRLEIALLYALNDSSARVVKQGLQVLNQGWPGGILPLQLAIMKIKNREKVLAEGVTQQQLLKELYGVIRKSRHEDGWDFALSVLEGTTADETEKQLAADALRHSTRLEDLQRLIKVMEKEPASVQQGISDTLAYITMRQDPIQGYTKAPAPTRRKGVLGWQKWLHDGRDKSHGPWQEAQIAEFMGESKLSAKDYGRLINKMKTESRDFVIYNIARYLSSHTDFSTPYEPKSKQEVFDTWSRWWRRNRDRFQ